MSGLLRHLVTSTSTLLSVHARTRLVPACCYSNNMADIARRIREKKRQTKRRESKTLRNSYILSAIVVAISFYYVKREQQEKANNRIKEEDEKMKYFRDPLMGKDAAMIKLEGFWLPQYMFKSMSEVNTIQAFKTRETDIIVASFPKSGTTWVQEVVTLIEEAASSSKDSSNSDSSNTSSTGARLSETNMEERFPYLEYIYPGLKDLDKKPGQRLMKTHLPYPFLPKSAQQGQGKVIYIARNPKDVCVSYYYFSKMLTFSSFKGCLEEFVERFIHGFVNYGPWPAHVLSYWEKRKDENLLFITYEDMHKDPVPSVKQVAEFLGRDLSDAQLQKIVSKTRFESMRNNPRSNYSWWDEYGIRNKGGSKFMRRGKVGDWKHYFSEELSREVDDLCRDCFPEDGPVFKET